MIRHSAALVGLLAVIACGEARPVPASKGGNCPTWKAEIQTALAPCVTCHEDLATYEGAIAWRDELADKINPTSADTTHRSFGQAKFDLLSSWTDECEVAYVKSSIHELGLMDPSSDGFHGADVKRLGWSLDVCAGCHGQDFKGGVTGVSCTSCHKEEGGPTACTTCHGTPPAQGAHLAHVTSPRYDKPTACTQCHVVPNVYTATGHVTLPDGKPDTGDQAELVFGDDAKRNGATPAFDTSQKSCSGVYCHGATLAGSGATHPQPKWTGGADEAACGGCHGAPPPAASGHPNDSECSRCHTGTFVAGHINGTVNLGIAELECQGCHGLDARSPNPLSAAHRSHVEGTHQLAAPLDCTTCHTVPATVGAAGHLDAAPAEVVGIAGGSYSADTKTCNNVGCHGGNGVTWTAGSAAIACGSCHGIPPQSGVHRVDMTLRDCVQCHEPTVDGFGNIKVQNGQSTHMNGRLN